MRRLAAPGIALGCAVLASRLAAQGSIHVSLGARYTSTLVHDSIVTALDVRPDVAPALAGALTLPLEGPWRFELQVDVSTSPVRRRDADGFTTAITRLWTLGASIGMRRRLTTWLEGRAAVGVLKHLPAQPVGLFAQGGGTIAPFAAATFTLAPPPLARYGVAFEITGDGHRFQTPALREAGFTTSRLVYRLMAGLRARVWAAR